MPYRPGDVIDSKYEIVERLGAGGMGEVYKATHSWLAATRVIKVVHPQISGSEDARERFVREARVATKVQHPNVATLHDFSGLPDGAHYMVWEYIDGENLAQRLRTRGTLPPREAVRVVIQALHGLEAIHRAGIIHRDISPENLMIANDGAIKIIDLGVAKLEDPTEVSSTRTGIFIGKLRYASPEQLGFLPEGARIDARTDLYSLGMVLFELLMGRPPYEAKSPHEYFMLHARDEQARKSVELPLDLPGGPALRQVLDRALERDRNQRFSSASEFAAALEDVQRTLTDVHDDATMRVVRQPAATTERTAVTPPAPPARSRSMLPLLAVIAVVFFVTLGGIAAVMLWPKKAEEPVAVTTTTAAAPVQPAQIAESSMDVVTTSSEAEPEPVTTTTDAPEKPVGRIEQTPAEPEPEPEETEPEPEPEPVKPPAVAASNVPAYVEGGDDDTNEQMLDNLRRELSGTRRVELRGGAMQAQLIRAMKDQFPHVQIVENAPVVVRFEGTLERLGRGRKRRAAQATITKNGRIVFRYELPAEVFRVGDLPAEAFAHAVANAFQEE